MNRIERTFKNLRAKKKKAFIVFITAGYPSLAITENLIYEFARAGVDIIELGVPFSDPLADGPVIQESSQAALEKKTHLNDILRLVKKVRKTQEIPLCLMTYFNPVFAFGCRKFVKLALKAGVDAVIVPDLPPEEEPEFNSFAKKKNLAFICFISPTTTIKRMRFIAQESRGFIYYISLTGVTGARESLPLGMKENIAALKRLTNKPVCVGFGVSNLKQVKRVCAFSDGVIVGSAIVKKIKQNIGRRDLVKRAGDFARHLASGLDN